MIESIQRDSKARRVTPSPTNYSDREIFRLYFLIISVTMILVYNCDNIFILFRMIRSLNFDSIYMSLLIVITCRLFESNRNTWLLFKRFSNRDTWILFKRFSNRDTWILIKRFLNYDTWMLFKRFSNRNSIYMSILNFVALKLNLKKLKSLNFDGIYMLNNLNIVFLESYLNSILLESYLVVDYMYLKPVSPIFDLKWLPNFVSLEFNFDLKPIHHDTKSKFSLNLGLKKAIVDFIAEMWKKNKQFLCLILQILNSISESILALFCNILEMFYHAEFMKKPALATFRILYF